MKIIAVDTATEVLSLYASSGEKSMELNRDIDLRHSEQLIPLVDWILSQLLLTPSDLDLVVVAEGPGSFTGLRIGMAFAKGFTAGLGCSYVAVPTLDAYAARFIGTTEHYIAPVIDAKKQRFYTSLWKAGNRITEYLDLTPNQILGLVPKDTVCILTGPHAKACKELLVSDQFALDPIYRQGAGRMLAYLGWQQFESSGPALADAGPMYIRKSDAELAREIDE